jgi:hypothetical protein
MTSWEIQSSLFEQCRIAGICASASQGKQEDGQEDALPVGICSCLVAGVTWDTLADSGTNLQSLHPAVSVLVRQSWQS